MKTQGLIPPAVISVARVSTVAWAMDFDFKLPELARPESKRPRRVAEAVKNELNLLLRRSVSDPRLAGGLKRDDTISIEENKYLRKLLVKNIIVILKHIVYRLFLISFLDYIVKLEFLNKF